MRHPIVDMAYKSFYYKSHIDVPLVMGSTLNAEDKVFKVEANKLVRNIEEYPHAFLLACLMDSGVDADVAWSIPYKIYEKVGSFDIWDLYKINEHDYSSMFNGEKKFHRYPIIKAKVFYDAIHKIVETKFIDGDASRIWSGKPSSKIVIPRFMDFNGCGFKIANMGLNLLYRYFGVEFSDYSHIDIAPDVHTMRVFQRLGLTPYCADTEISKIYTIVKARELNPEFPGIVDGLVWEVGREYCSASNPKCSMCKFNNFCKKEILNSIEIWN
jgi:endonuclease III